MTMAPDGTKTRNEVAAGTTGIAISNDSGSVGSQNNSSGFNLRWSRLVKTVQIQQKNAGLMRGSIAGGGTGDSPNGGDLESSGAHHPEAAKSSSNHTKKTILNEISGCAKPGEILALMGPSGSGKTSLLNCLSGRTSYNTGTISVNGTMIEQKSTAMKRLMTKIVYVRQNDIFFTHLTVRDQLLYTALLRLPQEWSHIRKIDEVNRIIKVLRLTKCQQSQISMISGGERKRVNIGTELLTDPSCILLDEPTSGLDSTSAVALIRLLNSLARSHGKTVITSIHQPNSALFRSFDKLMMLAEGSVVYFGKPTNSLTYLQKHNLICPDGYNAADHWMDLLVSDSAIDEERDILHETSVIDNLGSTEHSFLSLSGNNNNSTGKLGEANDGGDDDDEKPNAKQLNKRKSAFAIRHTRVNKSQQTTRQQLIAAWDGEAVAEQMDLEVSTSATANAKKNADGSDDTSSLPNMSKYKTGWFQQYKVLTHRALKNSRSAIFTPLNLIKSLLLGLVCGLVWFQLDYTEELVFEINSYCFFANTYWVFDSMFGALMAFPQEREVILKERSSASYHLSAYFMAKTTSEMPTRLILPFLFMCVSWWLAGIDSDIKVFLSVTAVSLLSVVAGEAFGLLIGASIYDMEKAMTGMTVISLGMMLVGGFFVEKLPIFITWVKYLSPFKYTFDAALRIVFHRDVPCDGSGALEELCLTQDIDKVPVDDVLEHLNTNGSVAFNVGMLVVLGLAPRYLAYLALRAKKEEER